MRQYLILLSFMLLWVCHDVAAQRTRPMTDVGAGENTFVRATIEDNDIILYAIYNDTTGAIRAYALWNNSEATAIAKLNFVTGDPITFSTASGTRQTISVAGRGYTMSGSPGLWVDENVKGFNLGHVQPIRSRGPAGAFPLPTER